MRSKNAFIKTYVKGGSNIFTDAFKKIKRTFKKYVPQALNFAKNRALDFVKTEGIKQAKKQAGKHGDKLLKMAMGKIANLAGGNLNIPVMKPSYKGHGLKYV